ncbi:MAG: M20 family metallopeptidase [Patescibacteria group bacterium]
MSDFDQDNLIDLTSQLIRLPTTADRPDLLKQAVELVLGLFSDFPGLTIKRYEQNDKPSLVILTKDTLEPDILLCGHLDVVPAEEKLYEPTVREGRLYGRGACDMKSGAAILISLMRYFAQSPIPTSLGLMLTTDEECGGANGVGWLVKEKGYRTKLAIIPDGGNAPDQVITKNKGLMHLRLVATGQMAHASRPWEGSNAIHKLLKALDNVRKLFPDITQDQWADTLSIGTIDGGQATNQVAEEAQATLDIRFTEASSPEKILDLIKKAAPDCQAEVILQGNMSFTDPNHPYLKLYSEVLQNELSLQAKFQGTPGGNDGRFLTTLGTPVLVVRPLSGGLHGPDEWLDVTGFAAYADLLKKYLIELTKAMQPSGD